MNPKATKRNIAAALKLAAKYEQVAATPEAKKMSRDELSRRTGYSSPSRCPLCRAVGYDPTDLSPRAAPLCGVCIHGPSTKACTEQPTYRAIVDATYDLKGLPIALRARARFLRRLVDKTVAAKEAGK